MQTELVTAAIGEGYAARPATKAPNWHGLVACDVLFNNLTTGLFLVAAVGELAAPAVFAGIAKAAYPMALGLLIADLLCLVLDLGDPLRFHHMLRVFKPSSPMSLGTWCLTVYSFPLTMLVAMGLLPGEWVPPEWIRQSIVAIGVLPAFGSAVYKGVLFSTSAQPGWKDARWLGGYFANSAFMLGCAQLLALSIETGQEKAMAVLRPALAALLLLNVVALGLLLIDVRAALALAYTRKDLARLGALVLGGGMLVPLCLLDVVDPSLTLAGVLFIVLGSLVVRIEVVRFPHVLGRAYSTAPVSATPSTTR
jgi:Ni/Fe-hydrogenase subunit HybB-like protein